jgi:hypothetical protein
VTPEEKIQKLETKVSNLLQDNSRLRRDLKKAQTKGGIFEALVDELQATVTPLDELPPATDFRTPKDKVIEEHLVMHLSDEHADEVVEKHQVGDLEKFDFPIALCRAEKYVDTVLDFTQRTLCNYRFPVLHILSYGDHTNGEIHGGREHSYYRNMFRNALAIGQMQALMIRDLAPYFKEIKVICLPGNHGRRSAKKDFNGPWDNWDYLVSETAASHCRHLKNVEFKIPQCFSICYMINGHGFHIQHGDDIKSWNSIPFYGVERKTRRLVALHHSIDVKVRYFVLGHFHMLSNMADLKGETFINGAWCGTTPYSYESFSGYREPMQLLHGVHEKHGVTWRLPVRLRDDVKEARGPDRYRAILAAESV